MINYYCLTGMVVGVGANETVPSSDQIKPQLVILEQPKSVSINNTVRVQ